MASVIRATGGNVRIARADAELFSKSSCDSISGAFARPGEAACCRFDPMGNQAIKSALASRRNLQRLTRMGPQAEQVRANWRPRCFPTSWRI